ncbi:MAG: DinB family protein [Edaphobacter sp.]
MELRDFFLEKLEQEAEASRKVVERVPEGRNDWRPHEKSMALGQLAALVAAMPGWATLMVERDELNLDDPASEKFKTKPLGSREELLKSLDAGLAGARKALEATTEAHLMKPWKLRVGGYEITNKPRYIVLSESLFSHLAHHRGQLTVYLRLNEASVPAIYGPSADEQF